MEREVLEKAANLRDYPVTRRDLERFLSVVAERQPVDLWDVIRHSDEYVRVVMEIFEALKEENCVGVDDEGRLRLTEKGRLLMEKVEAKAAETPTISSLEDHGIKLPPKWRKILDEVRRLYTEVIPKDAYDQAPLLPEAAVRKAFYIYARGDVAGKSVVMVGDDDLLSIIFALTGEVKMTLAMDIDNQLLSTIKNYSEKHGLPVETVQHDLQLPIPENLSGAFDTFVTEPPDTVDGITLFVSRGVELLRKEPGMVGYCGVSTTACPPDGLMEIQSRFLKMGLLISAWLPKFNQYPPVRTELKHVEVPDFYDPFYPPKKVWYISDLVRIKTTGWTRPYFKGRYEGEIADYDGDAMCYRSDRGGAI